ncbi:MAG TPA: TetR/AcrR family transcriptional regulator [Actinomycetes bacterium]|nr:TetR/AcrR family transcriptional regulator [Actinomycetes bacterium]
MTTPPYHHGNLRAALVETAAELARTSGPDGVVLREVARRTGVSHNAAYRHFADRDELLGEVADLGMDHLERAMRARLATVRTRDPEVRARRRLRETGRAYVQFALAEPGLFEVAFAQEWPTDETGAPDFSHQESGPYALLNQVLDELVAAGGLPPALRPGADVACWAAVHGFSMLVLQGPLRHLPTDQRDAALDAMLDIVSRGLT